MSTRAEMGMRTYAQWHLHFLYYINGAAASEVMGWETT